MDFSTALDLLKTGALITRRGWNGKGMYLFLINGEEMRQALDGEYDDCKILPTIAMYTGKKTVLIGWLASQTDILADDWEVIET